MIRRSLPEKRSGDILFWNGVKEEGEIKSILRGLFKVVESFEEGGMECSRESVSIVARDLQARRESYILKTFFCPALAHLQTCVSFIDVISPTSRVCVLNGIFKHK